MDVLSRSTFIRCRSTWYAALLLAGALLPARVLQAQQIAATPRAVGPLSPYHTLMQMSIKRDSGTNPPPAVWDDKVEAITWHGHAAIRHSQANSRPGDTTLVGFQTDILDAKTFLPYFFEVRRPDGAFLAYEINGLHVTETKTSPGVNDRRIAPGVHIDTLTKKFDLPEPVYTWLGGTPGLLISAMPLKEGMTGSFPAMIPDSVPLVQRTTYHVHGMESVIGPDGKPVQAWRVTLDNNQTPTLWLRRSAPHIAKMMWHAPGLEFVVHGKETP